MDELPPRSLSQALVVVEALGTIAFALSGLIEGARKRLDLVGCTVVAGLAALGGGTLRDVLLDRRPFVWVAHPAWLWVLMGLCLGATERAMLWLGALGVGLFAATGTAIALDSSMPSIVAVLMGVVTASFGGVLRDIVINEIPRAFSDHQPYALCAFAGGWVLVGLIGIGAPQWAALVAATVAATGLRMLAVYAGWRPGRPANRAPDQGRGSGPDQGWDATARAGSNSWSRIRFRHNGGTVVP